MNGRRGPWRVPIVVAAALTFAAGPAAARALSRATLQELFTTLTESTGQTYEQCKAELLRRDRAELFVRGFLPSKNIPAQLHARILVGWMRHKAIYGSLPKALDGVRLGVTVDGRIVCNGVDDVIRTFDTPVGRPLLYERVLKHPTREAPYEAVRQEHMERIAREIGPPKPANRAPPGREPNTALAARFIEVAFRGLAIGHLSRPELARDPLLSYVLLETAKRRDDSARRAAIRALGERRTTAATPLLRQILEARGEDELVRVAAARALAELGDGSVVDAAKPLAKATASRDVQIAIIDLIGEFGSARDLDWLRQEAHRAMHDEKDDEVRAAAVYAIRCITQRVARRAAGADAGAKRPARPGER